MIRKKPAPHLMRGVKRFSEKTRRKRAAASVQPVAPPLIPFLHRTTQRRRGGSRGALVRADENGSGGVLDRRQLPISVAGPHEGPDLRHLDRLVAAAD